MKFTNTTHVNEGSSSLRTSAIEIGDSSFMLDLVFTKLYSNPILAICREIASNCRDAHREAGTPDIPIEITMPNRFSTDIIFKDWGLGITPDRMDTIFTKAGRSSKRDSNLQVGGYGLGAKTPLAYTSQFSIITTTQIRNQDDVDILNLSGTSYNLADVLGKNMTCTYTISSGARSGEDAGGAKLHSVELTDEKTGTAVHIGVEREKISAFASSVVESTQFWNPRPVIIGEGVKYKNLPAPLFEDKGWALYSREISDIYGANIIIDGIRYPLNLGTVFQNITEAYNHVFDVFKHQNFSIFVNTGDVDINPSRESVHYTADTCNFIYNILKNMYEYIINISIEGAQSAPTYIEASDTLSKCVFPINRKVFWKDEDGDDNLVLNSKDSYYNKRYIDINCKTIKPYFYSVDGNKYSRRSKISSVLLQTKILLLDDSFSISTSRIENFISKNRGISEFIVLIDTSGNNFESLFNKFKDDNKFKLTNLNIEYLSAYDTGVKKKSSRLVGYSLVKVLQSSSSVSSTKISRENGSGYYVYVSDREYVCIDKQYSYNQACKIMKILNVDYVYIIPKELEPKLGKGFNSLQTLINERIESTKLTQKDVDELLELEQFGQIINNGYGYGYHKKTLRTFRMRSLLGLVDNSKLLNEIKQASATLDELRLFYAKFNLFGDREPNNNKYVKMYDLEDKEFIQKYPLLGMVADSISTQEEIKFALDYIELVDNNAPVSSQKISA